MYTRIKGGLKTAAVSALVVVFFDLVDNEGFSPVNTLMVFIAAFAIYEALGFTENKLNKWKYKD